MQATFGNDDLWLEGEELGTSSDRGLKGISFSLRSGLYTLAGPNGSGKTSLLRLLAGIAVPEKGRISVRWNGALQSYPDVKARIGYAPQEAAFYEEMSVRDYLAYVARMRLVPAKLLRTRIGDVAAQLGLEEYLDMRTGQLSAGAKRLTLLAQALLADPDILLLDEPLEGLDMEQQRKVLFLLEERAAYSIVLISHHRLERLSPSVREVLLMFEGRLLGQYQVEAILRQHSSLEAFYLQRLNAYRSIHSN